MTDQKIQTNPRYPIYIISKGRWESRLTSKALEKNKVPYRIVIEPQELKQYSEVIDPKKILVLPFSNLGLGGIPARNWVWEHSISEGHERHWILDDNIAWFARIHNNKKIIVDSGVCFKVTEDFVDRYKNVPMAGLQYEMFIPAGQKAPPVQLHTEVIYLFFNLYIIPQNELIFLKSPVINSVLPTIPFPGYFYNIRVLLLK